MTVEVKSNMLGYIQNIKRGVLFQDAGTVLDELVQNAQRSGASSIQVDISGDCLTVTDNGSGCDDPQMLFESNSSGWEDKPEAFGEGFFSVFYLGDQVDIKSLDWELSLDIDNLIKTGNLVVDDVMRTINKFKGFEISISGPRVQQYRRDLEDRAEELGALASCKFLLNGDEVDKEDIFETDNPFSREINNHYCYAVIYPSTFGSLDAYYENRSVCDIYISAVAGALELKEGAVTLKAPDRKEIVFDEKRRGLVNSINEEAKQMYLDLIKSATDLQIDSYESGIEKYLDVEDYAPILPVNEKLFKTEEDKGGFDNLSGAGAAAFKALSEAMSNMNKEKGKEREKNALEKVIEAANGMIAYVDTFDAKKMAKRISRAEYEGWVILYAPNGLYRNAFEYYGVSKLENLESVIDKIPIIENPGATTHNEKRLLSLMSRVETRFGLNAGSIEIADIGMDTVDKNGKILDSKRKSVHGICDPEEERVYLDRTALSLHDYRLPEPDQEELSKEDWRMLLSVEYLLCHELCHLVYATSDASLEHESAMADVVHEFAGIF